MNRRLALGLMVGCILIAALLRFPELTSKPPGLHFDEAANGILSGDIGLRGDRPVFISSYTGKEPLFFYLTGGLMSLLGESTFTLRLTAAFIGLLTVAAVYRLSRELLGNRAVGLFAAALLAISFWHILFSRLGFRAISQPLLQALAVIGLYHGLRRRSWFWIAGGGLALGLTAYTYLAARMFPIPLVLALIPLLFDRDKRRRNLGDLAAYFGIALIIVLPLVIFFLDNPGAFWVRFDQVVAQDSQASAYLDSYLKTLGMFFALGDPYMRFNIPDLPIFNWFWGGLAVVGWLLSLYRAVKESSKLRRSAYLLLGLIPLFMILPSSLAISEILPSNLRAIGLLPFIYILPALGLFALVSAFQKPANSLYRQLARLVARSERLERLPEELSDNWAARPRTLAIIFLLILIIGGLRVSQNYFQKWSTRSDLFYENDADLAAVAEYLEDLPSDGKSLFIAAQHYRHPTAAFLSEAYDDLKWLPGSQALVFPAESDGLAVYTHNSPKPDWASEILAGDPFFVGPTGPDRLPTFEVYTIPEPAALPARLTGASAYFEGAVTLVGYDIDPGSPGSTLPITLLWRVEEEPNANLLPFIHLEDRWGHRWSQAEPSSYPSEQWSPGDLIVQRVELPIPEGVPPGDYIIRTGIFEPDSSKQLAVTDQSGRYTGSAMIIDNVSLEPGGLPDSFPQPPFEINAAAGPNLKLLGYEKDLDVVEAGDKVPLGLWWQSDGTLNPHTIRIELLDENNRGQILSNSQPVHDTYPFSEWPESQFIVDRQSVVIPQDTPEGSYRINLRLLNANDDSVLTADLGPIVVEEGSRLFQAPDIQFPQDATFGSEIKLVGYNLEKDGDDPTLLQLVWQAVKSPEQNYTVFVHLLDEDGVCCIWQDDVWPQRGTYPTGDWLEGEFVVDAYDIELPEGLPPGTYPIEIGLYLPETGKRLIVEVPRLQSADALFLRPIVIK